MRAWITTTFLMALIACGDGKAHTKGPCESQADCKEGTACLAFGSGDAVCSLECSLNADDCGGDATCAGVGMLSVNVCQDSDKVAADDDVPREDERPRIPCSKDADCSVFDKDAVCVQWQGMKDCTMPCHGESDCDLPSLGGITVDFFTCLPDEANSSRSACVPDEACFDDPMSCISGLPDWENPSEWPTF